jgi:arginyl-tRNA synthetase
MDPFKSAIVALLQQAVQEAVTQIEPGAVPGIAERLIEQPPDPALGDYAFPCFQLAKALRKGPPLIAKDLAARIQALIGTQPLLAGVEAAGPYVNFRASMAAMAQATVPAILDGSYFEANRAGPEGAGRARHKVMIEYSQPNTHKAFHVGHMRNVALGDALVRIHEYNGHPTIAVNYIGDVGTHIAKCLWYYLKHRTDEPPATERGEWLGTLYTAATALLEGASDTERPVLEKEVSAVLQQLEAKQGEPYRLWQETRRWSLEAFDEIYGWLGARFDHVFYESDMEAGRQIVEDGLKRGVFQHSQGAIGIDLEAHKLGFFLLLKGDGTTLYATKDLALARIKFDQFKIDESIYVVGAEQTLHFQQVFKTLELLGYPQAKHCHHLAYGLVMLPEGKMSSRAGNIIPFSRLRREMDGYIDTHYLGVHKLAGQKEEWSPEEIAETARRIAVAAVRYGMVKQDPGKSIVFNMEDWLQTEGDTGTYLCYAFTRIQSMLRMVARPPKAQADYALLTQEPEKRLIRALHDFNRVVEQAEAALRPNQVANALFDICKEFSRAYVTSPVLKAESPEVGAARLALFAATGRLLERGLFLIGIVPPSRM